MANTKDKAPGSANKRSESKDKPKSKNTNEFTEQEQELTWQEALSREKLEDDQFTCSVVMFVPEEHR